MEAVLRFRVLGWSMRVWVPLLSFTAGWFAAIFVKVLNACAPL